MDTLITEEMIRALNWRHPRPRIAAIRINSAVKKYGINTPRRIAHFLAQITHESSLIPREENLNYSARRLMIVWPSRFPTYRSAKPFEYDPVALANRVYTGRMGNTVIGDGWRYRGRGLIQLTGRYNYAFYGREIGYDLLSKPELSLQYGISALVACAYWRKYNLNISADQNDIWTITKRINGGFNGLTHRRKLLDIANRVVRPHFS